MLTEVQEGLDKDGDLERRELLIVLLVRHLHQDRLDLVLRVCHMIIRLVDYSTEPQFGYIRHNRF